jgi:amino acid transporter
MVGFLMLAGAVNTSLIGANGVLNRVSEDGVLSDWFRVPHRKYGTSHRLINLIAILQLVTIVGSRGNVYLLGEAYAFGVIWSFAFKALAMVVLRFKDKSPRVWKVPLNFYLGNLEIPFGLGVISFLLFSVAGINLLTKEVATVSGVAFTLVFFTLFLVSERINHRRKNESFANELDKFGIDNKTEISNQAVNLPPNAILCPVRDSEELPHLDYALQRAAQTGKDLIVVNVKLFHGLFLGYEDVHNRHLFNRNQQILFTRVVAHAEKFGKHAELLVIPAVNVFYGIVKTASELGVSEIILGESVTMTSETQIRKLQKEWQHLPQKSANPIKVLVVDGSGKIDEGEINAGGGAGRPKKQTDENAAKSGLRPKSGALKT